MRRWVVSALALLASFSCRTSGHIAADEARLTAPVIPSVELSSFLPSSDSVGAAQAIRRACRAGPKRECYQKSLTSLASSGHVRLAMGSLRQLGVVDTEVSRNGHVYAHAIGIAAGSKAGSITENFSQCSESYQSGCYHGVIQAWFAARDSIGARETNDVCAPFRAADSLRWLRFQCVHGMGHGLTTINALDLPKGLAGCDRLDDGWERRACYGGAFMESLVSATSPHHTATKGADEHSEHASHDMASMSSPRFKAIDPTDQQYPCSVLGQRYQESCYQMQTSVMLFNNKGDIAGAARSCDEAPEMMRVTCYSSLGRDVSSYSHQNHREAIRMCSLGNPLYQPWCFIGLAKNIVDLNARPDEGLAMCRAVPTTSGKAGCYAAVGEQIWLLAPTAERRREMCVPADPAYLDACLYGAGLTAAQPASIAALRSSVKQ